MKQAKAGMLLMSVVLLSACTLFGPIGPVILYEETFANPQDWLQNDNADRAWWVENGEYHALIKVADRWLGSYNSNDGPFADFRLDVTARQVSGPLDNGYGVLFRVLDGSNYYRFAISGDGYACFHKIVNGTRTEITPWVPSAAINTGNAINQITILANGNSFTFFVNGTEIYSEVDAAIASGGVGIAAMMYDPGQLHLAFDDLLILELD